MAIKKTSKRLAKSRWLQILQELLLNAKTKEEIYAITKLFREASKKKTKESKNI